MSGSRSKQTKIRNLIAGSHHHHQVVASPCATANPPSNISAIQITSPVTSGTVIMTGNAAASNGDTAGGVHAVAAAPATTVLASPLNGQFYVIGNPTDVLGTSRTLAPRYNNITTATSAHAVTAASSEYAGATVAPREERRRATHNEVERRRRDTINTWIEKLGKLIPDLNDPGSVPSKASHSKGGILARACDYVQEAKRDLDDVAEKAEATALENERLRMEVDALRAENAALRQTLHAHGIHAPPAAAQVSAAAPVPTASHSALSTATAEHGVVREDELPIDDIDEDDDDDVDEADEDPTINDILGD